MSARKERGSWSFWSSPARMGLVVISLAAATSCQDEGVHVTLVAEGDATLQLTAIDVKAEDAGGKARTHRFEINGANSTLPLTLGLTFTDEARYPIQLFLTASSQRGVVATAETQLTQRREGETRITLRLRCTEADCRETPAPPAPPPPAPPPPDAGGVEPPPDASDPPPEVKPPPPDAGGDEPPVVMPPPPPPLSCHQPHTDEAACDDGDACTNDVRVPTTCGSTCVYRSAGQGGRRPGRLLPDRRDRRL
ncbi:MAG: hypothetical protein KA712_10445 [Myxococcales bacterium]|nr:hypothetical protein [Myxococcales bacterium]